MIRAILLFLSLILLSTQPANAQFLPGLEGEQVNIEIRPTAPEPFKNVRVSADAYTIDTTGASFTWTLNGETVTTAQNSREFNYTAPALGENTLIRLDIKFPDGTTITKSKRVSTTRIDITIEGDTLVPAFYKGRPVPSPGSSIRAVAIPNDGSNRSPSAYTYNWKVDNKPIFGGPVNGRNVAVFEPRSFDKEIDLGVDVLTSSGALVASKVIRVPVSEPELYFYEDNPLRGTSQNIIDGQLQQIAEEIEVRAEPFYMASDIFSQNHITEWLINGAKAYNPSSDPQIITLRRTGDSGVFEIGFHIRNLTDILQGARSSFTLNY